MNEMSGWQLTFCPVYRACAYVSHHNAFMDVQKAVSRLSHTGQVEDAF